MSGAQRTALVFGTVLLLAAVIGFVAVGSFWVSAGCAAPGLHGCSKPAPLSLRNSTLVIVGSVISTGVLVTGGVITFIAAYFPDPRPSLARKVAEVNLEDSIRRSGPSTSEPVEAATER